MKYNSLMLSLMLAIGAAATTTVSAGGDEAMPVTHGVASGDVTGRSAVIWSRTDGEGYMHVKIDGPVRGKKVKTVKVDAHGDYTG
ncbi:MAG: hypothetical protein JAY64_00915, partial [Candidatus Thiodiazotropha weberae]|nr:hypothetical protein [Candidatus Thiodiazotropha lotti]MCW4209710.1 hypothetical protein [Candidatus Thiodiazotropha lotti]